MHTPAPTYNYARAHAPMRPLVSIARIRDEVVLTAVYYLIHIVDCLSDAQFEVGRLGINYLIES